MAVQRGNETAPRPARVLVVDDEPQLLRLYQRVLFSAGYEVVTAADGRAAVDLVRTGPAFDAILSDIAMPAMDGLQLLRAVREHDLDVPVVLVTAAPSVESAARAVEQGALRYLVKPVALKELEEVVALAVRVHDAAQAKRAALATMGLDDRQLGDRAGLDAGFARALSSMWMAYQPIVSWATRRIYGYEALLRSGEPTLPHPGAVFGAAERLGRLRELSRAARDAASSPDVPLGEAQLLFVNLHPRDLNDEALFSPSAPLSRVANRVVLEITERALLDEVGDVRARLAQLRALGFRLAVDDLGAGYAGLTSFAQIEPDVVKLDMSLVRGVETAPTKQRLVRAMAELCRSMNILVVAEGVETAAERDALVDLGCDLLQGYFFARPGRAFPALNPDALPQPAAQEPSTLGG